MPRRLPSPRLVGASSVPTDLYFVQVQTDDRFIKIGVSRDPALRFSSIQACCPYELKLLKAVPGGAHLEFDLHQRFAGDRVRGEWFKPTPEIMAYIEALPAAPKPVKQPPIVIDGSEPWPAYEKRLREEGISHPSV